MDYLIYLALLLVFILMLFYMTKMPLKSYQGSFAPLTSQELQIKTELEQHITHLAQHIGPRHLKKPHALNEAATYLKNELQAYGHKVVIHDYVLENIKCENIIVEIKGNEKPEEIIIVSAHYDSVMPDCPGTNDNGSGVALPRWVPGVGWSDQLSFWRQGYPAMMITDTAPFRYPYYHTNEDTADKVNYVYTARVVMGIEKVVQTLAK